jgi:hypothetical protein
VLFDRLDARHHDGLEKLPQRDDPGDADPVRAQTLGDLLGGRVEGGNEGPETTLTQIHDALRSGWTGMEPA